MNNMNRAIKNICNSLTENGYQIVSTNHEVGYVRAVGNDGESVFVEIGPAFYCKVYVDNFVCTNMAQPYNVGEAARLRRHVGMFENVTTETTR